MCRLLIVYDSVLLRLLNWWSVMFVSVCCAAVLLVGCASVNLKDGKLVSRKHGFQINPIQKKPWRRTPDFADILALNDPSTSVIYYDNPYTGGVISLQVVSRHYPDKGAFEDELRFIYRRMLSTPHNNMRTVQEGRFVPFEKAIRSEQGKEFKRAEFRLKGAMGRRPTQRAREEARRRLEESQPFGGPRTKEEVQEEREFEYSQLTPAHTANYRGKVVVYLRGGKLFEFYYIDHELAFERGLRDFDEFLKSFEFIPPGSFPFS